MTAAKPDRLGAWCGGVLAFAAVLTPLMAWLGPLGLAPLVGLVGLLCLPALRMSERDMPLAIVVLTAVAWATLSSVWSPFHPAKPGEATALKLPLQALLYWSAWQGARRASPAMARRAAVILAWGLAAYGLVLLFEAFTGGALYLNLRNLLHDPIRPDLGRRNIAHGSFVLALLWPVAAAAGARAGAPAWLALPMAAGTAVLAQIFLSDAPVLAVGLVLGVGLLVWIWPRTAPQAMGVAAAVAILVMPLVVVAIRMLGLGAHLPLSWAERVAYWDYAVDRIAEHPLRGWGLDASRAFSPHIQLHPHNGAVQVWLELGALGAALAALVWLAAFRRLARDERTLLAAAAAGSAAVYLFFGLVSFGVWQEWWLALAALAAAIVGLGEAAIRQDRPIDAPVLSE